MGNGFGDYGPQETPPDSSPKRGRGRPRSFSRIEEDDEEQDEEQDEGREQEDDEDREKTPTQSKRDKGKNRAVREESREPSEVEDEIAQGLEDIGLGPGSDEEEEDIDQEPEPPVKKARVESPKKPGRKTKSTSKKENRGACFFASFMTKIDIYSENQNIGRVQGKAHVTTTRLWNGGAVRKSCTEKPLRLDGSS
jgi:hypothetical protein